MSPECQQLNPLFSQCVDGNHIRIPENLEEFRKLEDPPEPKPTVAPFILDILHAACTQFILHADDTGPDGTDEVDVMELFLTRDKMAISEFELLRIVLRWCKRRGKDILGYSHLLDFSALSDEERIWFLSCLPPSATTPSLVRNGLLQSDLVTPEELHNFRLGQPRLHWKPIFKSSTDRMGRFLPTMSQALKTFHKKLIVLRVDERLTVAIYVPKMIERASEVRVDTSVIFFAFPHSQGLQSPNYKMLPTKVNYKLFCDEHVFQLYEGQRRNTWIFLKRPQADDSLYRSEKNQGDQRRTRDRTLRDGTNFDCKVSIALDKVSRGLQQHIGKVQQNGVLGAEIYVISNRDVNSIRVLDEWLNFVDTDEVLPLFEKPSVDYEISKLHSTRWADYPEKVVAVVRDKDFAHLRKLDSLTELRTILSLLNDHDEKKLLHDIFSHVLALEASSSLSIKETQVASALLGFLPNAAYLIPMFFQSQTWKTHKSVLEEKLVHLAFTLLRHLVLLSEERGSFIQRPIQILLQELKRISLQEFAELVELIALTVRSSEAALDILLEVLEPECSRLFVERPTAIQRFTSSLFGIALDHIDEASSSRTLQSQKFLNLSIDDDSGVYAAVKSVLRVDSSLNGKLKTGDHVRLTASDAPRNAVVAKLFSMDAVVTSTEPGKATFRCLHRPPSYLDKRGWSVTHCGSFVTTKASFDAVTVFYTKREACTTIYGMLLGIPPASQGNPIGAELPLTTATSLNKSQNAALMASMKFPLTFIWGPPGTGKTHTIVVIMTQLLEKLPKSRFLVTAPTHNAVDNLLRRFVSDPDAKKNGALPVRVSTQVSDVTSNDLSNSPNTTTRFPRLLKTYVHIRAMPCWAKISAQTPRPAVRRSSASKTPVSYSQPALALR
jgi:regulator of nonsense transcripts 1